MFVKVVLFPNLSYATDVLCCVQVFAPEVCLQVFAPEVCLLRLMVEFLSVFWLPHLHYLTLAEVELN